eukprot:CAMPEP_0183502368 /NCGR_PEP_ID=MMETSP0371-20130417/4185_1 /TAXON_ID=268820 /ORGANISM="Peridinium aciculiferum, Strain PAER-2" /LENGTH=82 /DNA_ID=CAMNT_0025697067 /DNA_START=344 /DNA_END=590 /DNA_ORIENTATION=+
MTSRAEANHLQLLARETKPFRSEGPRRRALGPLVVEIEGGAPEESARRLFEAEPNSEDEVFCFMGGDSESSSLQGSTTSSQA